MVDTKRIAVACAAAGFAGLMAFVVGAALLAAEYAGVWAGVAVFGGCLAGVAAVGLYAIGEVDGNDNGGRRR